MTTKEAIRILDPETTAEALAEIEYYAGFSGQTAKVQAVNDACEIAVSALRDQQETGWISVEDRLPEPLVDVLAWDSNWGEAFTAFMTRHNEWVGVVCSRTVTHWMPLPEAPKEEA